jgi:ethanolamine ammonia-lyase small subunit
VQIVVGDGLSAAAMTNNLPIIYPVIEQGLKSAGISVGTPFFIKYARVGVINRRERRDRRRRGR